MRLIIIRQCDYAVRLDRVTEDLTQLVLEAFAEKQYGKDIQSINIMLVSWVNPKLYSVYKQRKSYRPKLFELNFDVILNFDDFKDLSHKDQQTYIASAILHEADFVLSYYVKKMDLAFDKSSFLASLKSFFSTSGFLLNAKESSD